MTRPRTRGPGDDPGGDERPTSGSGTRISRASPLRNSTACGSCSSAEGGTTTSAFPSAGAPRAWRPLRSAGDRRRVASDGGGSRRAHPAAAADRPRRLVLLCDISGSMEPYARAYLQLLHSAVGGARAEAFVFATRLTRLTRDLRVRQPEVALQRAGRTAPDWSGGTRIGEASRSSTTTTDVGGWRVARSWSSSPTAGSATIRRSSGNRWLGCPGWPTGSCGSTHGGRARATNHWSAAWPPPCRTWTRSSAAIRWRRSTRSSPRSPP
jgi:hypothetical protein